jgi:glycosyltransferase involved in cell wall biosynthesis
MKILFLLTEPPFPPFNGVRIKTYNLLKGLHENGHELHLLFFFDEDERYDSRVESEILKFCCTVHAVKMDNRRLRLLKNFLLNVFGKEIITFRFISAVFLEELRRSVSSVSFDVVHFDLISLTAYRQPLLGIAPLVASINDSYTLWLKNKFFNSPVLIQRGLFELLFYALTFPVAAFFEKKVYADFEKIHVVSEVDKNFLLGLNPRLDVTVIPNGVDTNFYKSLVYAQHENELCFVGSMGGENAANILWFMREVFVKVKADNPNIKLIIVGKNPPVELIQQAKLVGGVDVTGFVKDIRPYIERATLIVDPTVKSCGILNHILQSMAMGKVVVGTNSSFLAIKGAVDNEHMVVARSSDDFATKIELLLRDESKRRQIGFNARCLMEKSYRWANTVSQYEKMYNAAIQKHAGGRGL